MRSSALANNETNNIAQVFVLPFITIAAVCLLLFSFMVATKPDPSYMAECRKLGGDPIVMKRGTPPSCKSQTAALTKKDGPE